MRQTTWRSELFDTYASVVSWSNISLALTLILSNGCHTKQVDYNNAFYQEGLKKQVFIEPHRWISVKDVPYKVLKLINSLYGLKQAPHTFFEKLRDGIIEQGFVQSEMDKWLFIKPDMIYIVYLDDEILSLTNAKSNEEDIKGLSIWQDKQRH